MGLVGQKPVLFNKIIHDNIAYGKQGSATEDDITEAAKQANATASYQHCLRDMTLLWGREGCSYRVDRSNE